MKVFYSLLFGAIAGFFPVNGMGLLPGCAEVRNAVEPEGGWRALPENEVQKDSLSVIDNDDLWELGNEHVLDHPVLAESCFREMLNRIEAGQELEYSKETIMEAIERYPSFSLKLQGDSVDFSIIAPTEVSLVQWTHLNHKNHKLVVPEKVEFGGKTYTVVKIGKEAMGRDFYGNDEFRFCEEFEDVKEVVLPQTIRHLGYSALMARFWSPLIRELPSSVRYMNDYCVPAESLVKGNRIVFPPHVAHIGVIWANDDLKPMTIVIPDEVRELRSFEKCGKYDSWKIKDVKVAKNNPCFKLINGVLFSKDGTKVYWNTLDRKRETKLYVPQTLKLDYGMMERMAEWAYWPTFVVSNIKSVEVEANHPTCMVYEDVLYDKSGKMLLIPTKVKELRFPQHFSGMSSAVWGRVEKVVLPDSLDHPEQIVSCLDMFDGICSYRGFEQPITTNGFTVLLLQVLHQYPTDLTACALYGHWMLNCNKPMSVTSLLEQMKKQGQEQTSVYESLVEGLKKLEKERMDH